MDIGKERVGNRKMIDAFDNKIAYLAREDSRIIVVGADDGRYESRMTGQLENQYLNVGISECNAIGMAAGLSCCGKVPFVTAGGTFLVHRANEFIRNDICMQNRNVKIVALGAGVALNALGNTQHLTEDIASLRVFPNLKVLCAASPKEAEYIAEIAVKEVGPMYIRLGRCEGQDIYLNYDLHFELGRMQHLVSGKDMTIFSTGTIIAEVMEALPVLKDMGIQAEVINVHTLKPIDKECVLHEASRTGKFITVEEHSSFGGLYGIISEIVTQNGLAVKMKGIGLNDCFAKGYGSYKDIKQRNGLSAKQIIEYANELMK